MKKKLSKNKVFLAFLFSILVFSVVLPGFETSDVTVVSIVPTEQQVGQEGESLPESFNITVKVTQVTDLFAWQVRIFYSSKALNATNATYPQGHVFQGKNFQPAGPLLNQMFTKTLLNETTIDITSPIGSKWGRITETGPIKPPSGTQTYNVTQWLDKDESGSITTGDIIFLEPRVYPTFIDYYYIDRIEWEGSNIRLMVSISYMEFGATLLAGEESFTGSGDLCQITFDARRPGIQYLNFSTINTILLNSTLGSIDINELFSGSVTVYGIMSEADKDPSSIIIDLPSIVKLNSVVTITGKITPFRPGVNVTIYYKPPGGTESILAIVLTNEHSVYTCIWNATSIGDHEFYAKWDGDAETKGAESIKKTIKVTETGEAPPGVPNYLLYAGIVIVIILIGVLALYFAKFKKR